MDAQEYTKRSNVLERRLRDYKRNITGVASTEARVDLSDINFFEARFDSAQTFWEKFMETYMEREELAIEAQKEDFPNENWTAAYDTLHLEMIRADGRLRTLRSQLQAAQNSNGAPTAAANATLNLSTGMSRPHLPEIPVPSFYGDLLKWTNFRDTFVSLIHDDPALTNVQRFHYLVGALKGEAAALVKNFPIDDQSYEQAWTKVKNTYDNPRVLASLLVQRILDTDTSSCRNELQRYEIFLTGIADSVEAFRALKLEKPEEFLLASLALRALDSDTRRHFELSLGSSSELPTVDKVIAFVRQRRLALKMSQDLNTKTMAPKRSSSDRHFGVSLHVSDSSDRNLSHQSNSWKSTSPQPQQRRSQKQQLSFRPKPSPGDCANCQGHHPISRCRLFSKLSPREKMHLLEERNLCFNCLSRGHRATSCFSRFRCRECGNKHHSLIHDCPPAKTPHKGEDQDKSGVKSCESKETFTGFGSSSFNSSGISTILLGTVQLIVKGLSGKSTHARAVLDSGSQHTFISASLAQKIGARISKFGGNINSLGESEIPSSTVKGITSCYIAPRSDDKELKTQPIVVERITSALPSRQLPHSIIQALSTKSLADQKFGTPGPVDVLVGADLYFHILSGAPYPADIEDLFYCPTIFGLVVSGQLREHSNSSPSLTLFLDSQSSLHDQLKAFWELEEPSPVDRSHPDDIYCEEHFLRTHSRTKEGRYVVRLPFKSELPVVGINKEVAFRRFYALEAKFRKDPTFSERYQDFMREYSDLGHMSPAPNLVQYIIPHHGVWQDNPQGRKLRVVFDASCPSSNKSLNDVLHAGPKLQEDISMILIRFRLHAIAICTDLVKMYRQVLIHPHDRRHQHILWRADPSSSVQEMELNTVTYGVKSSAFHALRVIRQLVQDEGQQFPLATARITRDMYVDDVVTGVDSPQEAAQLVAELTALFARGGFTLSKWASSLSQLLPSMSGSDNVNMVSIKAPEGDFVKILGLFWNPSTDAFSYTTQAPPFSGVTKRTMLSAVARIFDPLGLLAPVIFSAKSLIQAIWMRKLDWDDPLPEDLKSSWDLLIADWSVLSTLSIPRYVSSIGASLQLIGFCDASSKGYAAALYVRSESPSGDVKVSLIKAKSKVAPTRFHSIARLELCGALLLSRLVSSVTLPTSRETVCFTDSEVVLSWLGTPTHDLKVFEANRVAQILSVIPFDFWRHVSGEENPADLASRGSSPHKLKSESLWWDGPRWLKQSFHQWYQPRQCAAVLAVTTNPKPLEVSDNWTCRFSSFISLVRNTARILRFMRNARIRATGSEDVISGPITASEFLEAELRCVAFVQRAYFPKSLYSSDSTVSKEFANLQPFIDQLGLVRVGGRLQQSSLPADTKHPILLPYEAHFSQLLIDYLHSTNFHAGSTLCLSLLRSKYWIPKATRLIRGRILRCVRCRILKAKPLTPLMAPLPKGRVTQCKPFAEVGVDYAGPFLIKESRRRNASLGKSYLCLFVCFASKALHLELVSSLSTPAFLSALDRFVARRGAPSVIWSDNGSNFIGASKFIREVFKQHRKDHDSIQRHLVPHGTNWKFIPPRAPHFGGLWEAGVKSVKILLLSTVGKQPYTFEELSTIFSKIEALLNSRPLCPLTEDVHNLDYLTPSHLTHGAPLTSLPQPSSAPPGSSSMRARWELMKGQINHVWKRWSKDYLHTLQQRSKWTRSTPGLKAGDLVILLERRSDVGQWPVGRVVEAFPGRDGITRTVTLRTPSGSLLTRAVTSLAPLFFPEKD